MGKTHKEFLPLSSREEEIGKLIVDAAYAVHNELGPGLLEKIYESCFCYELGQRGLCFKRQIDFPIRYKDLHFNEGLRLDVLVEDSVVCELKAVEEMNPVWQAQILSHLHLLGKRLGYLINFNVPLIKHGIKRYVL
ncbi:MAG: GxxExxY protein [Bacteroidetes bacterium]|nr:GxxExxY protein [Bacteroidota bacterium]MCW5895601.1 GxxExxY protein [Bacteroidota bacterium]